MPGLCCWQVEGAGVVFLLGKSSSFPARTNVQTRSQPRSLQARTPCLVVVPDALEEVPRPPNAGTLFRLLPPISSSISAQARSPPRDVAGCISNASSPGRWFGSSQRPVSLSLISAGLVDAEAQSASEGPRAPGKHWLATRAPAWRARAPCNGRLEMNRALESQG